MNLIVIIVLFLFYVGCFFAAYFYSRASDRKFYEQLGQIKKSLEQAVDVFRHRDTEEL